MRVMESDMYRLGAIVIDRCGARPATDSVGGIRDWEQQTADAKGGNCTDELCGDESWRIDRANSREGVRQRSGDRDARIREGGGRSEPVCCTDPTRDHPGRLFGSAGADHKAQETKRRKKPGEPLSRPASDMC